MRPPERAVASRRLRSILICHADSRLNREGVARWLASFTDLAAIVLIDERGRYTRVRVRNEIKRIGVTTLCALRGPIAGGWNAPWKASPTGIRTRLQQSRSFGPPIRTHWRRKLFSSVWRPI
jgi:hypothetical protein